MVKQTTIRIPKELKKKLDELKIHKNQAYYEVIEKLLKKKKVK
jgi:predicted DNA-binding protein